MAPSLPVQESAQRLFAPVPPNIYPVSIPSDFLVGEVSNRKGLSPDSLSMFFAVHPYYTIHRDYGNIKNKVIYELGYNTHSFLLFRALNIWQTYTYKQSSYNLTNIQWDVLQKSTFKKREEGTIIIMWHKLHPITFCRFYSCIKIRVFQRGTLQSYRLQITDLK